MIVCDGEREVYLRGKMYFQEQILVSPKELAMLLAQQLKYAAVLQPQTVKISVNTS